MTEIQQAIVSTAELAELFAVTTKTVREWARNGMPLVIEGKRGAGNESHYDLYSVVRWYFESNHEKLELDRQRARLAEEQADKYALENAVRRGELGNVSEMADYYGQSIDRAQRRLQQIPQTLAQYVDERSAARVVSVAARLIDESIAELAADGPPLSETAVTTLEAAPVIDGQPVGRRAPKAKRRK